MAFRIGELSNMRQKLMDVLLTKQASQQSAAMMPYRNQAGGFGFIGGGESRVATAAEDQAFNERLRDRELYGRGGKGGIQRERIKSLADIAREKMESTESIEGQKRDIEEKKIFQAGVLAQEKAKYETLKRSTMTPKERADVELKIKEIDARQKGLWNIRPDDQDTSGGMTGGKMPVPGAAPLTPLARAATAPKQKKYKIPAQPLKTPTGMDSILGTAAKTKLGTGLSTQGIFKRSFGLDSLL